MNITKQMQMEEQRQAAITEHLERGGSVTDAPKELMAPQWVREEGEMRNNDTAIW